MKRLLILLTALMVLAFGSCVETPEVANGIDFEDCMLNEVANNPKTIYQSHSFQNEALAEFFYNYYKSGGDAFNGYEEFFTISADKLNKEVLLGGLLKGEWGNTTFVIGDKYGAFILRGNEYVYRKDIGRCLFADNIGFHFPNCGITRDCGT